MYNIIGGHGAIFIISGGTSLPLKLEKEPQKLMAGRKSGGTKGKPTHLASASAFAL